MTTARARRWGRALAILALVATPVTCAPSAAAEAPLDAAWWWVGHPTATVPTLMAPAPTVPEGGLYVAGGASGASGISALRFELSTDSVDPLLTLVVADSLGTPTIIACPATTAWTGGSSGAWDERPAANCDAASVVGSVADDGQTVKFDLAPLRDSEGLDLVLLPATDPDLDEVPVFSTSFEPPGAEALTVRRDVTADRTPLPEAVAPGPRDVVLSPGGPSLPAAPVRPAAPPVASSDVQAPRSAEPLPGAVGQTALAVAVPRGFAYPAVLLLPLALLAFAVYFGWAFTQPMAPTLRRST